MRHDRALEIRETWDRVRIDALNTFENGRHYRFTAPGPIRPILPAFEPGEPATRDIDNTMDFEHQLNDEPGRRNEWRVVCEGVVLEMGRYE